MLYVQLNHSVQLFIFHIYFCIPAFMLYVQLNHSAKCTTQSTTEPPKDMQLAAQHALWSHQLAGSNSNLLESCRILDKTLADFMKAYNLVPVEMTDFRPLVRDFCVSAERPADGQSTSQPIVDEPEPEPEVQPEVVAEHEPEDEHTGYDPAAEMSQRQEDTGNVSQEDNDAAHSLISLSDRSGFSNISISTLSSIRRSTRTASQSSAKSSASSTTLNSNDQQSVMDINMELVNAAAGVSPPYSKRRRIAAAVKVPAVVPKEGRVSESSSDANLSVTSYSTTIRGSNPSVLKPIRFPGDAFGTPEYMDHVFLHHASKTESEFMKTYDVGHKEPSSYSKFLLITKPGALPLGFKFPEVLVADEAEAGGFNFISSVNKIFESVNERTIINLWRANKV